MSESSGDPVTYPGAHRPDRRRVVDAAGLKISVAEWGDPDAPPLLAAHGGFDFAETFDVFAPMLVEARLAGRSAGTNVATATRSGPSSTAGTPTSATPPTCSPPSATAVRSPSSATPRAPASCCRSPMRSRTGSVVSSTSTGCRRAGGWRTSPNASAPSSSAASSGRGSATGRRCRTSGVAPTPSNGWPNGGGG